MPDFIDKIDLSGTYIPLNDDRMNTDIFSVFKGKNMLCFGDSWAYGTGSTTDAPPGATYENSRFTHTVCSALGMNEMNYAEGASGFMRPLKTIDQVTAAVSAMSDQEKADTKVALLISGVNDLRNIASETLSDVLDEIQNVINTITNNYPNCFVLFGINITMKNITADMHDWLSQMAEKAQTLTNKVQYVNISDMLSYRDDLYISDGLHPNYPGHQALAGLIISSLLGNSGIPVRYMGRPTLNTGYTLDADTGFHLFKVGPLMVLTPCQIQIASAQQSASNRVIGSLPAGCGAPDKNMYAPVFKSNAVSGAMAFVDNRIFLNTLGADGSAYVPSLVWLPYY